MFPINQLVSFVAPYASVITPVVHRAAQHTVHYFSQNPQRLQGLATAVGTVLWNYYSGPSTTAVVKYEGPNCKALITNIHSHFPQFMDKVNMENHTDIACRVNDISRFCTDANSTRGHVQSVLDQINEERHIFLNTTDKRLMKHIEKHKISASNFTLNNIQEYAFESGKWHEAYRRTVGDLNNCDEMIENLQKQNDEWAKKHNKCEDSKDNQFAHIVNMTSKGEEKHTEVVSCKDDIAREKDKCTVSMDQVRKEKEGMQKTIDNLKDENAKLRLEISQLQKRGWFG